MSSSNFDKTALNELERHLWKMYPIGVADQFAALIRRLRELERVNAAAAALAALDHTVLISDRIGGDWSVGHDEIDAVAAAFAELHASLSTPAPHGDDYDDTLSRTPQ